MARKARQSDKLRDMDTPMVLGYELNRQSLTPVRRPIHPTPLVLDVPAPTMVIADIPRDPAPHTGLMRALAGLSSGTLATLSKITNMAALDNLQADLLKYYATEYNPGWQTWIDVWKDYDVYRKQS